MFCVHACVRACVRLCVCVGVWVGVGFGHDLCRFFSSFRSGGGLQKSQGPGPLSGEIRGKVAAPQSSYRPIVLRPLIVPCPQSTRPLILTAPLFPRAFWGAIFGSIPARQRETRLEVNELWRAGSIRLFLEYLVLLLPPTSAQLFGVTSPLPAPAVPP